jgi:hypothetical protein
MITMKLNIVNFTLLCKIRVFVDNFFGDVDACVPLSVLDR